MGHVWNTLRGYGLEVQFLLLPLPRESKNMEKNKHEFGVVHKDGKTYISQADIVSYLAGELSYTAQHGKYIDELSEEFINGMIDTIGTLLTNFIKIGQ